VADDGTEEVDTCRNETGGLHSETGSQEQHGELVQPAVQEEYI
jgi:hypothetical protein